MNEETNPSCNPFVYTPEEWRQDWEKLGEASQTIPAEQAEQYCRTLFRARYPNPREADWKLNRQLTARHYVDLHADSLEKTGWVLTSGKTMACTGEITFALYLFFGQTTEVQLKSPPDPEQFGKMAEDVQRKWKKA